MKQRHHFLPQAKTLAQQRVCNGHTELGYNQACSGANSALALIHHLTNYEFCEIVFLRSQIQVTVSTVVVL